MGLGTRGAVARRHRAHGDAEQVRVRHQFLPKAIVLQSSATPDTGIYGSVGHWQRTREAACWKVRARFCWPLATYEKCIAHGSRSKVRARFRRPLATHEGCRRLRGRLPGEVCCGLMGLGTWKGKGKGKPGTLASGSIHPDARYSQQHPQEPLLLASRELTGALERWRAWPRHLLLEPGGS